MARAIKATPAEVKQYAERVPAPLYPLSHWVKVGGVVCPVEGLFEGKDGVNYEVMAPAGFHFGGDGDGCHTLLCYTLADVSGRAASSTLAPCSAHCK